MAGARFLKPRMRTVCSWFGSTTIQTALCYSCPSAECEDISHQPCCCFSKRTKCCCFDWFIGLECLETLWWNNLFSMNSSLFEFKLGRRGFVQGRARVKQKILATSITHTFRKVDV